MHCPLCNHLQFRSIYCAENLPLFQNKVFNTKEEAILSQSASIELVICQKCGFIWNKLFDGKIMDYDRSYHNEQHYSGVFKTYLQHIAQILIDKGFQDKKIVEIGCGKGYFLELLQKRGCRNIVGFDPAYEGSNELVIKDYFRDAHQNINAEVIILRHVLEHIEKPFEFLHRIAKANRYEGTIFIEVPDFEWISRENAFWDIYHEHCNYFTRETLASMFEKSEIENEFDGQYMYLLANLEDLKTTIEGKSLPILFEAKFSGKISFYHKLLSEAKSVVVWGGSSKGVTFLNLLDKDCENVRLVIDINPQKQQKFIAGTGHIIVAPDELMKLGEEKVIVIVTNENYFNEIRAQVSNFSINAEFVIL